MDYMTELSAIAKTHGGIIETKIAAQRGISKAVLYKLCKENRIHRIVKGQYILPDDIQDELLAISNRSNKVIFSHETALYLHGISDRTPFEHMSFFLTIMEKSLGQSILIYITKASLQMQMAIPRWMCFGRMFLLKQLRISLPEI